jgi:hypothetical protein
VQAALALYLLPVVLLVLLVGAGAIVAGAAGRVLRKVAVVPDGPAVVDSGFVRRRMPGILVPHRFRKTEYRLKNRSA